MGILGEPAISTEVGHVGLVGKLERGVERVVLLLEFGIRVVDGFGEAGANLVEKIIPVNRMLEPGAE